MTQIINQLHAELMQSVEPSSPMVTSAKSLHSLLDRPDIAAERGRLLSAERRLDPALREDSSTKKGMGGGGNSKDAIGGGGGGIGGADLNHAGGVGQRSVIGEATGDGVIVYKRGGGMGGGRGLGGRGKGGSCRPVRRLGGVEEGTSDDEGEEEGGESEGAPGQGAVAAAAAAAVAAVAVEAGVAMEAVETGGAGGAVGVGGAGGAGSVLVSVE